MSNWTLDRIDGAMMLHVKGVRHGRKRLHWRKPWRKPWVREHEVVTMFEMLVPGGSEYTEYWLPAPMRLPDGRVLYGYVLTQSTGSP